MDFFSLQYEQAKEASAPLAQRMRPKTLEDFAGQKHLIGKGKALRRMIEEDRLTSMIFYGPPGTGKTTLAKIIANTSRREFLELSAVTSGIKDIRDVMDKARYALKYENKRSILFIDEIHRFNKTQQDALLPFVEKGVVTLIGATTENPFFQVNKALLSRVRIFELKSLGKEDLEKLIHHALEKDILLSKENIKLTDDGMNYLVNLSGGDARSALNALEMTFLSAPLTTGDLIFDYETISKTVQVQAAKYDRDGDEHYNTVSAFIKSVRGSDPDAALYYLAKMIVSGEDPRFIARRLMILAAEDIGTANPQALVLAVAAFHCVEHIGMPEGRIPLAETTVYLATSPKSNAAYAAIDKAIAFVKKNPKGTVPPAICDSHYPGASALGKGEGYRYPHSYPGAYVKQEYLPEEARGEKFFTPTEYGEDRRIQNYLEHLEKFEQ